MQLPRIPVPERRQLSNGLTVYSLCGGNQDLLRVSISIPAGHYYSDERLVGAYMSDMLTKGSASLSAEEFARKIEFYGAYIHSGCDNLYKTLTISCMTKHFADVWPIIAETIISPALAESELELVRAKKIQQHKMLQIRTNARAMRRMSKELYAPNTRYAIVSSLDDHQSMSIERLKQFHSSHYSPNGSFIFIAGKPTEEVYATIEKTLDQSSWPQSTLVQNLPEVIYNSNPTMRAHEDVPNAQQASLIMGNRTLSIYDPDYYALQLTVHILGGGYLGSRLMSNIREEKGLTYSIGAFCMDSPVCNELLITSDVNKDKVEETISEIKNEINKLQQDIVSREEFDLALSILKNQAMQMLDGTIATGDLLTYLYRLKMNEKYQQNLFDYFETATPEDVLQCAQKYLDPEQFITVDAQ